MVYFELTNIIFAQYSSRIPSIAIDLSLRKTQHWVLIEKSEIDGFQDQSLKLSTLKQMMKKKEASSSVLEGDLASPSKKKKQGLARKRKNNLGTIKIVLESIPKLPFSICGMSRRKCPSLLVDHDQIEVPTEEHAGDWPSLLLQKLVMYCLLRLILIV